VEKLSGLRCVVRSRFFPSRFLGGECYKNSVIIGFGGNVGETKKRFERVLLRLKKDKRFFVKESSVLLKNAAFGFVEQSDFLNAVVWVKSSLSAAKILSITANLEIRFGRKRSFKNAPRTLDLDLLYFSKRVRKSARLVLPHPGVSLRPSVFVPLGEMWLDGKMWRTITKKVI